MRIEAFDGSGPKAKLVGEAADCEARDPATRLVTLTKESETQGETEKDRGGDSVVAKSKSKCILSTRKMMFQRK